MTPADGRSTAARARPFAASSAFLALVMILASQTWAQHRHVAAAQQVAAANPQPLPVSCQLATDLPIVPEIQSHKGRLKATLKVVDGQRTVWDSAAPPGAAAPRCGTAYLRYFTGHNGLDPYAPDDKKFAAGNLLPGPTLRARVGDWIEIAFLNQINLQHFGNSLDQGNYAPPNSDKPQHAMGFGNPGTLGGNGCDITTTSHKASSATFGSTDTFPDCLHGSSTTNIHFHGTHTTPSTTGDNVLLFVRPALQKNGVFLQRYLKTVNASFPEFFARCETTGVPTQWDQMPTSWRTAQEAAIKYYDRTTPYLGGPKTLPERAKLWPVNKREIQHGLWPQYSIGASPYCFHLPKYDASKNKPPFVRTMGQSPGTHWYHAHKHGSTAMNVANGMVGALIIEGAYDDQLNAFYRKTKSWDYQEKVLVIQQLTAALKKTDPTAIGPPNPPKIPPTMASGVPVLSVNGRRSPVITMRPNQVQLFRFVNGAERDGAMFQGFVPQATPRSMGPQLPCSLPHPDMDSYGQHHGPPPQPPPLLPCVHWNQIAQDGVQLNPANYDPNNTQDTPFWLAPANRADLLVQAPPAPGRYDLMVSAGVCRIPNTSPERGGQPPCGWDQREVLLTVSVAGPAVAGNPVPFIPSASFPTFPAFLSDIQASDVVVRRELVFADDGTGVVSINGQLYTDKVINQAMLLNAVEEWKVVNTDNDKEHPFHIHINPFQIIEIFAPQAPAAQKGGPCYADPTNPDTWKPTGPQCAGPQQNFVWWDTFAIPASRWDNVPGACNALTKVPAALKSDNGDGTCQVKIPGYFKMRSQFVDFPGQYVLHCHILTHEDRGMMQLIEVVADKTLYTHH